MGDLDLVTVLERIYSDEAEWLERILDACRPALSRGVGVAVQAFRFDADGPLQTLQLIHRDIAPDLWDELLAGSTSFTPAENRRAYQPSQPVYSLSECVGADVYPRHAATAAAARIGVSDAVAVTGATPDGYGVMLIGLSPTRVSTSRAFCARWAPIGTHLAAGLRLRTRLGLGPCHAEPAQADAVFRADGRLVDAQSPEARTRSARLSMTHAVQTRERARGRVRRSDPERAIALWNQLLEGQYTLLDHVDTDGTRFVLAYRTRSSAETVLSTREREVLALAAKGHANKYIALTLGLPPSTVASALARAATKLGARSRAELIQRAPQK